ncbi:hypothetical protein [Candidatus Aciduliprofundum boonei]|uniref:Monooxygenase n=1 Tax=Aciduliprofundum boonei (strain DSM 19572 / T469) TaxID=439481 RepID=D3T982_ACIB4|nr:hypothetical protein [Candidatus Aciduliprofundum boonei]ADD08661.1 putative monooxygenase [Aciduliprofundum boonei T469]HII55299.1 hypothetical protein [Candidatus Aciduliprofundum boonei]
MNKKIIVGIILVAGIALGLMAMHTPIKLVNASTLEVSGGNNAADGPHPSEPGSWQIMPSINTLDGPHPSEPGSW